MTVSTAIFDAAYADGDSPTARSRRKIGKLLHDLADEFEVPSQVAARINNQMSANASEPVAVVNLSSCITVRNSAAKIGACSAMSRVVRRSLRMQRT